jgi:hypothetical protein
MKDRNNIFLIELLMIYVLFYIFFFFIFFFILGSNSVELIIGFSFIFLLSVVYFYFSDYINQYFLSISKNIWLHFSNILFLLKLCKEMILNINKTYLMFIEYKTYILYNINYSLDFIFSNLVINLSEKYFINSVLNLFYNKLILISRSIDYIDNTLFIDLNDENENEIDLLNIYSFYISINNNG